jgi:hypothetical protein
MDLNFIKQKMAAMQQKPEQNKGGNKDLFWKPPVGKVQIRIVPSQYNDKSPFKELLFYYGIDRPVMISPLNFGEKDPIAETAKQLRQTSDKENWRLAKKLDPKMRVFAPVVVRGEEDKGVRLWQFGKEMYLELLSIAEDDDIGDYTDVAEGRDFTVDTVGPEVTGTSYNKSSVRVKTKQTPLSENATEVKQWLETQPNPEGVFKKWSYEEMKQSLVKFLVPEDAAEEGDIIDDEKEPEVTEAPKSNYSLNTSAKTVKQSKADKFDEMFESDLPFDLE